MLIIYMPKKGEVLSGQAAEQAALIKVHELAEKLEPNWKDTIQHLIEVDPLIPYREIALHLAREDIELASCYQEHPRVFIEAIAQIVRTCSRSQTDEIRHQKNVNAGRNSMRKKQAAGIFDDHQRTAGEKAAQKLQENGGWAKRQRAMLEGQGAVVWSEEESALLDTLLKQSTYRSPKPRHPDSVDLDKIAGILNSEFHQGQTVRTVKSIRNHLYQAKRKIHKS